MSDPAAVSTNIKCHRFVVVGKAPIDYKVAVPAAAGNQGQNDTGKNGMGNETGKPGLGAAAGGPFKKGICVIDGEPPLFDMGAIEFPTLACVFTWLESSPGVAFRNRYEQVFILATHSCAQ